MGMLDKFLDIMRLTADDDYDDEYYDDYEEEPPKKHWGAKKSSREEDDYEEEDPKTYGGAKPNAKVTPIRSHKQGTNNMKVCVIKPTSVEDAREITETLLMERTVVLNVEGLDVDVAQRLIDFTSVCPSAAACRRFPAISSSLLRQMWIFPGILPLLLTRLIYRR